LLIVSRDLLEPAVADPGFTTAVAACFDLPEAVDLARAAVCPPIVCPVLPLPMDALFPTARTAAFRPATLRTSFDALDADDVLALAVEALAAALAVDDALAEVFAVDEILVVDEALAVDDVLDADLETRRLAPAPLPLF